MAATANGRVTYTDLDAETDALIGAVVPLLKAEIRHTRTLLTYLTELDRRLAGPDTHSPKEAQRNGSNSTETTLT